MALLPVARLPLLLRQCTPHFLATSGIPLNAEVLLYLRELPCPLRHNAGCCRKNVLPFHRIIELPSDNIDRGISGGKAIIFGFVSWYQRNKSRSNINTGEPAKLVLEPCIAAGRPPFEHLVFSSIMSALFQVGEPPLVSSYNKQA